MRVLRNLLLLLFLAGLVAFNVAYGLRRFEWRREAWVAELRERAVAELTALQVQLERWQAVAHERQALERAGLELPASRTPAPPDLDGELRALGARHGVRAALRCDEQGAAVDASLAALARELPASPPGSLRVERALVGVPGCALVLELPPEALVPPPDWRRTEALATVLGMVGVTLGLLAAGVVFLRLSARSFRLRETERYLRWIRRLTDRYRALMEGAADMLLVIEPEGERVREANLAARAALGVPAGPDAEGAHAAQPAPHAAGDADVALETLFRGADLERVREAVRRAGARPGSPEALPELRVHGADGRQLVVDGRVAVVDVGERHIAQLSLRDLSAQKEIERRLQTHERLSSLGLLTAGVAHEINNPLEGIGNYVALLESERLAPERRAQYLEAVKHGFERIRDIVRDLLHFSRGEAGRGAVDLVQVVERALSMAAYGKPFRGVEVVRAGLDRPCHVLGDAGRLEQVLLNLLLNAARATGRGRVFVSLRRPERQPGQAELEVADEGPGIAPEHLDRVFDPFFTTEGGTGLGLSVSYGIIKAHGGELHAGHRPGGGAAFSVLLPLADAHAGAADASEPTHPATRTPEA